MKNETRLWMLSKDEEFDTIVNCNTLGILDNLKQQPLFVKGANEKEIDDCIKQCL